jgi:hypothetical protein
MLAPLFLRLPLRAARECARAGAVPSQTAPCRTPAQLSDAAADALLAHD